MPDAPFRSWASSPLAITVTFLIGLLPVTMMTELRGGSANFWLLIGLCVVSCLIRPSGILATRQSLHHYRFLMLALLIMPITALFASLWSHTLLGQDIERASRVFLGMLVVLGACLSLSQALLRHVIWGVMAGVIGATGTLIWKSWPHFARPDMPQYTTVGYSNALLLLTVLILFSLGWRLTRYTRTEQMIKVLTVAIGLVGVVIAETRSSWVAMPFFILIGLFLARAHLSGKKLMALALLAVATSAVVFFAKPTVLDRAKQGYDEFVACNSTTPLADTSVCIRLQLWRASWHMFKENPLIANAGSEKFEAKLAELHSKGVVSAVTKNGFGEPHNDFFYALSNYGILGLFSFLLLYFVPAFLFAKRLGTRVPHVQRVAAAMGLAVCLGFVAFGLTEMMFRSMRMLSFYVVMVAWLLALSEHTHGSLTQRT